MVHGDQATPTGVVNNISPHLLQGRTNVQRSSLPRAESQVFGDTGVAILISSGVRAATPDRTYGCGPTM
ncbi:hypothetical protein SAMN00790413_05505 [Deinococcus hopiensis KR-140]|uniref:Uncharacterized protein n=1 Tax=Deinococcus hopiensis KR-140 TaxID=695939 RepID=A0A1W1UGY7_9DEIO|nr:hypothetical protein SAMN00790413_05505 [Deinococcus hopiensis KR-140]